MVRTRVGNTHDAGGLAFVDCVLEDSVDRPVFTYEDGTGVLRLVDVTGSLKVRRAGRATHDRPVCGG